ncbi:MAG TPA: ABC transporter permease [Saprospiraceae bacterium]|nr:ABC transporter permease [Saprospiraceae bacterium]HPI07469.1 ABC transporter permease [Saprospiraceae bacterium]
MLQNYFRLAVRHLLKNRTYAVINITGLAVGVAACLLIFRLVHYELSFNTFFKNHDRIGRIVTNDVVKTEGEFFTAGIPVPAMDEMQQTVTAFEQFARIHLMWPTITVPSSPGSLTGRKFAIDGDFESAIFTEPSFFAIFDWPWLAGDAVTALKEPNSVVLSEKMADKCFGTWQMALGQTLVMDNNTLLTVRGIVGTPPPNSDFQCNVIVSYETLKKSPGLYFFSPEWGSTSSSDQAFALLPHAGQQAAANTALAQIGQEHYKSPNGKRTHAFQPLSEVHYDERYGSLAGTHLTEKNKLWVLSLIGLLVLAMACFNFVNLATALAAGRSREVGVRKSLGGARAQLIKQFMGETFVLVAAAVACGALLAVVCAPLLQYVSDVPGSQPFLSDPVVLVFLLATTLVVSLLGGFYPSIVLSGFEPVKALKNRITSSTIGGVSLRKALVVAQFVIAQALIIGTLVTISQMNFLRKMDLGFQPDLVYVVQGISSDSSSQQRFGQFKNDLQAIPAVSSVSFSSDAPSSGNNWAGNFAFNSTNDAPFSTYMKIVDADYFNTYGLQLVAGRMLQPSDTVREYVVNEHLLKKLGITDPQEAIGKNFRIGGGRPKPVVGVVKNFTANSAKEEMKPMAIFSRKSSYSTVGIKIRPENLAATQAAIQRAYEQTFPEQVFDGMYMDEKIAEYYRDESRFSALCKGFAALAIFISCLGLYGLATLMAVQRTKEIGIRKVLGASVASVVSLLSRDFLALVLVAAVIASPLAYYAMHAWLQDFIYRTPMSWWLFAATIGIAMAVALLTVGLRTWSAARANPTESLKNE